MINNFIMSDWIALLVIAIALGFGVLYYFSFSGRKERAPEQEDDHYLFGKQEREE